MTILKAALKSDVYEAARTYLEAGISILPVKGKEPAIKTWKNLQAYRATLQMMDYWENRDLLHGVGVICGKISGNLVVIDLDSQAAVEDFQDTFTPQTHTLTILSGSGRGAHFYFYTRQLPPTTIAPGYELRANGMYVVAPPSVHPSGNFYTVAHAVEPLRLDDMDAIVEWVKSKRPAPPAAELQKRPAPSRGGFTSREEYFRKRYVETALVRQIGLVAAASPASENRNNQLYQSAIALGQLVGAGALDRTRAETELLTAARLCGLTDAESVKTIKSGLDAGGKNPRKIPPPPPLPKK